MRRLLVGLLAATLLASCAASGPKTAELEKIRVEAGLPQCPEVPTSTSTPPKPLPNVELECLGGGRTLTLSSLRGEPTLLVAFAQWCGPCREELPVLARGLPGAKVRVLLVNAQEVNYADAVELLQRTGVKYPVLVDEDKALGSALKVAGLPYSVLVDADGNIVDVHVGGWKSVDQLRGRLREKLGVQ